MARKPEAEEDLQPLVTQGKQQLANELSRDQPT